MTLQYPSRLPVSLLVVALALPLILGAARSLGSRPATTLPGNRSAVVQTQPAPGQASPSEVLVGELSCQLSSFDGNTFLSLRVQGTVPVSSGGMGELISSTFTAPENPCPGIYASAAALLVDAGCTAGAPETYSLKFVCHDDRDGVLEVMASMSQGVLAGSF